MPPPSSPVLPGPRRKSAYSAKEGGKVEMKKGKRETGEEGGGTRVDFSLAFPASSPLSPQEAWGEDSLHQFSYGVARFGSGGEAA